MRRLLKHKKVHPRRNAPEKVNPLLVATQPYTCKQGCGKKETLFTKVSFPFAKQNIQLCSNPIISFFKNFVNGYTKKAGLLLLFFIHAFVCLRI